MSQEKYIFKPCLGLEENIMKLGKDFGSIYFTTDTRKIYLNSNDSENFKIPMGGNVGLFYGNMQLTIPPADGEEEFLFNITDIEGNETEENILIPNENDLILNSDGCFYKVLSHWGDGIDTVLNTKKLTIAGTGGNGSSSGGEVGS